MEADKEELEEEIDVEDALAVDESMSGQCSRGRGSKSDISGARGGKGRGYATAGRTGGKGGRGKNGKGASRNPRARVNRKYAVCDVLFWDGSDMVGADTECRMFWLSSRFAELPERTPRRARPLVLIPAVDVTA